MNTSTNNENYCVSNIMKTLRLEFCSYPKRETEIWFFVSAGNTAEGIFEAQEQLWLDALLNTTNDPYGV